MNKKKMYKIICVATVVLGILTMTANAAEIHGMKWDDSNGNALKDPGELGVQGVTICYYNYDTIPYPGNCGTTTGSDGSYSLLGLLNGTYQIYEVVPPGKAQTFPIGCPYGVNCSGGVGWHQVTVQASEIKNDINFGNADASEIHGTKFNDSNGDGVRNTGELGVSGIDIVLKRIISPGDEKNFGYTTTDINGEYNFTGLSAGDYKVEETGLLGVSQTYPAAGAPHYLTLGVGDIKNNIDFGNQQVPPGEIRGKKFNDSNGNGVQDGTEEGVAGVDILLTPSGITTTTDANGDYIFINVPVGFHTVFEELMPGYTATTPKFVNVKVNSSETSIVNFGNRKLIPPPSDVSIVQQSGTQDGIPTINRPGLSTLTIQKDLSAISSVLSVELTLKWSDGTTKTSSMTQTTPGNWQATFSEPFPSGAAQMTFNVDIAPAGAGSEDIIQIGDVMFVDPSGQIKSTCDNQPIEGAEVTLYVEFPIGLGKFIVSPSGYQLEPNPQITLADGYYGWNTIPGTYKVKATKTGYNPNESENVTVPPPKTGVDILLAPTNGCYSFTGFFSPVENPPALNKAKAGSTIPLKFDLNGNHGTDIFANDYPKSSVIDCELPIDTVGDDITASPGNSKLSYDQSTGQYNYKWKTEKIWTGCRQLVMKLKDGTYHRANFDFSK